MWCLDCAWQSDKRSQPPICCIPLPPALTASERHLAWPDRCDALLGAPSLCRITAFCLFCVHGCPTRARIHRSAVLPLMQAYDQHLNMILGEVEEILTTTEMDDETFEEIIKVGGASATLRRFFQNLIVSDCTRVAPHFPWYSCLYLSHCALQDVV